MKLKKRLNLILTFILSMTMVLGSVLVASASEISDSDTLSTFEKNLNKYFTYIDDMEMTFKPEYKKYGYLHIRSEVPMYMGVFQTNDPDYSLGIRTYIVLLSESGSKFGYYYNTTDNEADITEFKDKEFELLNSGSVFTYNGKTYNGTIFDGYGSQGIYNCSLPVYYISNVKFLKWDDLTSVFGSDNDMSYVTGGPISFDKSFYLKNVGYSVRAENSSEYPDETYIKFTWDIDNLQEGDLLEIRTRNHYTKIGGDQVIGFHDYITVNDGISCYSGSYEMSQTDAVKSWFATLDNKPLVFKDYDTDIYFLRPVRGNQYGLWVKVTMGRTTPTSSPYIKDIEYGNITDSGDWITDDDVTAIEGGNHGIDQNGNIIASEDISNLIQLDSIGDLFKYLFDNIKILIGYFGQLPELIKTVIGWLPNPIIALICCSIVIVIILRIFGR